MRAFRIIIPLAMLALTGCFCVQHYSTHSARIQVSVPGSTTPEMRGVDYERAAALIDTWARGNGLERVAEDAPGTALRPVGGDKNRQTVHYKLTKPEHKTMPLEVVVVNDASVPWIDIMFVEGYDRQITQKLRTAEASLMDTLKQQFGERVEGRIW